MLKLLDQSPSSIEIAGLTPFPDLVRQSGHCRCAYAGAGSLEFVRLLLDRRPVVTCQRFAQALDLPRRVRAEHRYGFAQQPFVPAEPAEQICIMG